MYMCICVCMRVCLYAHVSVGVNKIARAKERESQIDEETSKILCPLICLHKAILDLLHLILQSSEQRKNASCHIKTLYYNFVKVYRNIYHIGKNLSYVILLNIAMGEQKLSKIESRNYQFEV